MLSASDFFDLAHTDYADLFHDTRYVWEAIQKIESYIEHRFRSDLTPNGQHFETHPSTVFGTSPIFIGEGTTIDPGVCIENSAIIGKNCKIKHGAYLRSNVILGDNVIVGMTQN